MNLVRLLLPFPYCVRFPLQLWAADLDDNQNTIMKLMRYQKDPGPLPGTVAVRCDGVGVGWDAGATHSGGELLLLTGLRPACRCLQQPWQSKVPMAGSWQHLPHGVLFYAPTLQLFCKSLPACPLCSHRRPHPPHPRRRRRPGRHPAHLCGRPFRPRPARHPAHLRRLRAWWLLVPQGMLPASVPGRARQALSPMSLRTAG